MQLQDGVSMFEKKAAISGKPCKPYGVDVGNYFDDYFAEKEHEIRGRQRK